MRSNYWRNGLVYLLILTAIVLIIWQVMERSTTPDRMDITELAQAIREGRVERLVATTENKIEVTYRKKNGEQAQAVVFKEYGVGLLETAEGGTVGAVAGVVEFQFC